MYALLLLMQKQRRSEARYYKLKKIISVHGQYLPVSLIKQHEFQMFPKCAIVLVALGSNSINFPYVNLLWSN